MELDHVILFLAGPRDIESLSPLPGNLSLGQGTRHVGQGTRNRRIAFAGAFLELLWIDSPAEAAASGLRFTERCWGPACPFGIVFRGDPPPDLETRDYIVPNGPELRVVDEPAQPFLAFWRLAQPNSAGEGRRVPVNGVLDIVHLELTAERCPVDEAGPQVTFLVGEPAMEINLSGGDPPLRLRPGTPPRTWKWS